MSNKLIKYQLMGMGVTVAVGLTSAMLISRCNTEKKPVEKVIEREKKEYTKLCEDEFKQMGYDTLCENPIFYGGYRVGCLEKGISRDRLELKEIEKEAKGKLEKIGIKTKHIDWTCEHDPVSGMYEARFRYKAFDIKWIKGLF